MGIQFAPGARGRIEFSDRLLLSSRWVFQEARELMHRPGPVSDRQAFPGRMHSLL